MTFSPNDFRAVVNSNKGFLKLTRYRVRFPIPQAMVNNNLSSGYYNLLRTMEYYTDSFDFPGMGFITRNVVRYGYGPSEKKPVAPGFSDIAMTVYNDATSLNFNFFRDWLLLVQNFDMTDGIAGLSTSTNNEPYELFYKDEYAVDGMVTLLSDTDEDVVTVRMRQMFPIHIPEMKIGWAIKNDIQRFRVIFSFTDWYTDWTQGGTLVDQVTQIAQQGQQQNPTQGLVQSPGQSGTVPTDSTGTQTPVGNVDIGVPEVTGGG